jgi:hypothetical protein
VEYALEMAAPSKTDLESHLWLWIKKNKKEDSRLEFKLRVDLSTPGAKAEFIRDVIALANSEGENPRAEGHLVIGFKNGKLRDVQAEHYDGARLGELLDSHIYPPVETLYEEYGDKKRPRVGVLIVKPKADTLYVISKRLLDEKGHLLLLPGQSWGRKSDRKVELSGEAIHARLKDILDARVEEAVAPFEERIRKLQDEGGPVFEVKRIRFEMERTGDWAALDNYLDKLLPYAREFDESVKHEVLNAVREVTTRTRQGMTAAIARSVDTVLLEVMPVKGGGFNHPAREPFSQSDQELIKRIEHLTFEMTWDACRYLRNIEVFEVCARLYWYLIRFTTLNRLRSIQSECLHNARYCRDIAMEERGGKPFTEAYKKLGAEIADALDAFECDGYSVTAPATKDLSSLEVSACIAIIKTGEAVDWRSARRELPLATAIALAWMDKEIVGVGAIKRERREYAADIAAESGVEFPSETLELGYVAVVPGHRGHHISDCVVRALLKQYAGPLFATTYNQSMKDALIRAGFRNRGRDWKGRKHMLSLWMKE